MKEIEIKKVLESKNLIIHHQKRERMVMYDDLHYYKIWVPNWEHSQVLRNAFEIGFYDKNTTPAFSKIITENGLDRGYIMYRGTVAGNSNDNWNKLINQTSHEQRLSFIKNLFQKAVNTNCIPSDMSPSNIILYNGKISLIDLEGFQSFEWLFHGKPQQWEAQNRNLKKAPNPFWRDMSKNILSFLDQCVGLKYNKKLDRLENIIEINNKLEDF